MPFRQELLLLLLVTGFTVLGYQARLPTWFVYTVMLVVLLATQRLAPEWFEATWLRLFWWACVATAFLGLGLECLSFYGW